MKSEQFDAVLHSWYALRKTTTAATSTTKRREATTGVTEKAVEKENRRRGRGEKKIKKEVASVTAGNLLVSEWWTVAQLVVRHCARVWQESPSRGTRDAQTTTEQKRKGQASRQARAAETRARYGTRAIQLDRRFRSSPAGTWSGREPCDLAGSTLEIGATVGAKYRWEPATRTITVKNAQVFERR